MKRVLKYSKFLAIANLALASSAFATDIQTEVSASLGYGKHSIKQDVNIDMKSNFNHFTTTPALAGMAKYKASLSSLNLDLKSKTYIDDLMLHFSLGYGKIISGTETCDTTSITQNGVPVVKPFADFLGEKNKSTKKKRGNTVSAEAGFGYRFDLDGISIIPSIGYSHFSTHVNDFLNTSNYQTEGALATLSKYKHTWSGPYINLESVFKISDSVNASVFARYTHAKYNGKLSKAAVEKMVSEGKKTGRIFSIGAAANMALDEEQQLGINYNYSLRRANIGNFKSYLDLVVGKGNSDAKGKVSHDSHEISVNYTYSF